MQTSVIYSNRFIFDTQDNPFINFLRNNPIRLAMIKGTLHFVTRDVVEGLGYSTSSTQYLTRKCKHTKRLQIENTNGFTAVNAIPIADVITLVFHCSSNTHPVTKMRSWFLELAASQVHDEVLEPIDNLEDQFEQPAEG